MKTYVITLSKTFPKGHQREGESTNFDKKFLLGIGACPDCSIGNKCNSCLKRMCFKLIHTIRANYPLWKKRIAEVERGEACLSVRKWSDKPYRSKQVEIARLTKEDGVGIQMLALNQSITSAIVLYTDGDESMSDISTNDGFSYRDWKEWFRKYDLSQPLAIIHFTKFRY